MAKFAYCIQAKLVFPMQTFPNFLPHRFVLFAGVDVPHPGVSSLTSKSDQVKYHKYYQWVCFVLFFQAMLFYIPRYLWKTWEGGRMKMLVMDLNCPIVDEENKCGRKKLILDYFISNIKNHNFYAFRFFFCEVLNFINCVGQIFFMDMFLGKLLNHKIVVYFACIAILLANKQPFLLCLSNKIPSYLHMKVQQNFGASLGT